MDALCSSTWSVARSYRDTRLHGSVSPQIIRRIDFSFLASFYSWGKMDSDSSGEVFAHADVTIAGASQTCVKPVMESILVPAL